MAITKHPIDIVYQDTVYKFVWSQEALVRRVYSDSLGIPTLGIGYALIIKGRTGRYELRESLVADLARIGVTLSPADRDLLGTLLENLNNKRIADNKSAVPMAIIGANSDGFLIEDLLTSDELDKFSFTLPTEPQIRQLYDISMYGYPAQNGQPARPGARDDLLRRFRENLTLLARTDPAIGDPATRATALFNSLDQSREMMALSSMAFNGPGLIGLKLTAALYYGDRAEAWYEIRYNSGASHASRRFLEADTFALYEPGYSSQSTMRDIDAKGALRAYTRHQAKMDAYETSNQSGFSIAVAWGTKLGISVDTLTNHLEPARLYLINKYVDQPGYGITISGEVYVGENDGTDGGLDTRYYKGTDTDILGGSDKNDLIFGESGADYLIGFSGDDVIYGGSGNDRIIGGPGSDVLLGGAGNDTYYVGGFDPGQDRIEDKQGNDTVVFNGIALKYFVKKPNETVWQDLDKRFRAEMQGTDLKVTDTQIGNSVILNENFANGDFGIRLIDLPAEPTEDTATGPNNFWGVAPPNAAVSSTKTITTTTVSKNGVTTTTRSPDPLPPSVTDTEILFKSEQVSNTTVTTGQGTPETTDDTSTTLIELLMPEEDNDQKNEFLTYTVTAGYLDSNNQWWDYNQTATIVTPAGGNLSVLEVAIRPSMACDPRLVPIGDNGEDDAPVYRPRYTLKHAA